MVDCAMSVGTASSRLLITPRYPQGDTMAMMAEIKMQSKERPAKQRNAICAAETSSVSLSLDGTNISRMGRVELCTSLMISVVDDNPIEGRVVGDELWSPDECTVGERVGALLVISDTVGIFDGDALGAVVGTLEGVGVGFALGVPVSLMLGERVGDALGTLEGVVVGVALGCWAGARVVDDVG